MAKNVTKIVGWFYKKAFSGDINGKHIESPEKICFNITQTNNPDVHGLSVDTLKVTVPFATQINNGNQNYDNLIGCEVRLEYQLVGSRPQLTDIVVINADGSDFVRDSEKKK